MTKRLKSHESVGKCLQECFVHTVWKPIWADRYLCWAECHCGAVFSCLLNSLRTGHTTSCGCYKRKVTSELMSYTMLLHGGTHSVEYRAWASMKHRIKSISKDCEDYYDRGITVEDPLWVTSYEAFLFDMNPKPHPSYSLERLDNERGYCQQNCVWADKSTQRLNQRLRRKLITIAGASET